MRIDKILIIIVVLFYAGAILKAENVPELFFNLVNTSSKPEYVILVEKSSQKSWVLKVGYPDLSYETVKTYPVSTGSNHGDKQVQGDLKTPEGCYLIESYIPEKDLPAKYGSGAYVLNYPNTMDRTERKTGGGIWLHGTDLPELIYYDTRGCVRYNNAELLELDQYIVLGQTLVFIQDKIEYKPVEHIIELGKSFPAVLSEWIKSWNNLDLDNYISFYHQDFRNSQMNMDLIEWRNYKKELFNSSDSVVVKYSDVTYLYKNSNLLIKYKQEYKSDNYSDEGIKKLLLIRRDDGWKILGEEWFPLK